MNSSKRQYSGFCHIDESLHLLFSFPYRMTYEFFLYILCLCAKRRATSFPILERKQRL